MSATRSTYATSAEIYGSLPDVTEAAISPDGTTIAVLQKVGDSTAVVFYDAGDLGAAPMAVGVGATNARDITWGSNEYLLLLTSVSDNVRFSSGDDTVEYFRWISISKFTGKTRMLLGNESGWIISSPGTLLATTPDDAQTVVIARSSSSGFTGSRTSSASRIKREAGIAYSLFEVNLTNGNLKRIERGEENTIDWVVDESGEAIARVDYDSVRQVRKIYLRNESSGKFELVRSLNEPRSSESIISLISQGGTPETFYAITYRDRDKRALVEYDPRTNEMKDIVANDAFDIRSAIYDVRNAIALGARFTDDVPRTTFLDSADNTLLSRLRNALPGAEPRIVSRSANNNMLIIEATYSDFPKQFYTFDRVSNALSILASTYESLVASPPVAEKTPFNFVAPDGLTIPGYLTLPKGVPHEAMPLIVLPHGGPASRSTMAFDWWSFFYASRGYAVYEPNFRGSDGYGSIFKRAGYGEWGRAMQDDVTNGVRKLVADGLVDPARICIVGASYGGYAALAGATLTPDLYACAVSVNGVTNLQSIIGASARDSRIAEDYWRVRIGSRTKDAEALRAVSPIYLADSVTAPILLIHSEDDIVVPVGHSREMRNALRDAGKEHEFVILKGDDHWLSDAKTRTQMLRESIEFIDRHIGQ
ncbi:MAG: S9 family peptidase [Pseudomonadota bacterium]